MDKASEAAALAGIGQNPHFSLEQRLAAANKALDYYVDQRSVVLQELLAYLESKNPRDEDGDSTLGYYEAQYEGPAYADAATKLRRILDGE
jgi:hypothetical protein